MKFKVIVLEAEEGGYGANSAGLFTQSETIEEMHANIREERDPRGIMKAVGLTNDDL